MNRLFRIHVEHDPGQQSVVRLCQDHLRTAESCLMVDARDVPEVEGECSCIECHFCDQSEDLARASEQRLDTWQWTNRCPDCYDRSCGGRGCQDERPDSLEPLQPSYCYCCGERGTRLLTNPHGVVCDVCYPRTSDGGLDPCERHLRHGYDPLTRSYTR